MKSHLSAISRLFLDRCDLAEAQQIKLIERICRQHGAGDRREDRGTAAASQIVPLGTALLCHHCGWSGSRAHGHRSRQPRLRLHGDTQGASRRRSNSAGMCSLRIWFCWTFRLEKASVTRKSVADLQTKVVFCMNVVSFFSPFYKVSRRYSYTSVTVSPWRYQSGRTLSLIYINAFDQ